jgi:hypothetical protein
MHLRELSRLRAAVVASAAVAALVAVWSVATVSLLPPRLEPRALDIATAFTQVMIDTPRSSLLDLRQSTNDVDPLTNRALLIGTLMASAPVRAYIARRAGVTPERLQIVAPRTPRQPRARTQPGVKRRPTDLLASADQYRLDIQANPSVPMLDVYAQAPTAKASERLANAAVAGLSDYLRGLGQVDRTPAAAEVRLRQLGTARGSVINKGVQVQVVLVVFVLAFSLSCAAAFFVARVRRGWQIAGTASP